MLEKLNLEEFRKYKEEQQQLLGRLNEEEETLKDSNNYNEEDFLKKALEELSGLQNRLLSYDLSDIPFEEWEDVILVSSDNYKADFSKTKANLDFEILDIPITGKEIYNFKGCNVKNIESLESYSDTFFDEKTIEENSSLFLSDKFSQDIKDKYYSYNLSIKDISNLSDEQINELENKTTHNFDWADNTLISLLGIKKSIELYKKDSITYQNIIDLFTVGYLSKDDMNANSINILDKGTPAIIKDEIYKQMRENIIATSSLYKTINKNDFPSDFVKKNKDLFLENIDIPLTIKDKYFNRSLTYQDVKDNLEFFKTIPIEFFMERNMKFVRLCERLGSGNFQRLLEKYPETIDYLMENDEAIDGIAGRLPHPWKITKENNKNEMIECFFKEAVKDYYIEYTKNNNINILDVSKFPLWLKPLNINKIVDKYQDINDLLGYNTNTLLLDENQRKTIVEFTEESFRYIKRFDDETHLFSKHGMDTLKILKHIDFINLYGYDEFQEKIATELYSHNKYYLFDYDYITGDFREKHPNIFIDFDAPEPLRKAFYEKGINGDFIKEHLDCLEYIRTSNRPLSDFFETKTSGLIDNIEKTLGRTEAYEIIISYLKYFEKINFGYNEENLTKTALLDEINKEIFKNITNGNVDYNNDIHESFKKKYPSLFINDKVPKEIKDKFYNREFTLDDFNNDIDLFKYFKDTNIACAFGKDYYWTIPLFENIDNDKANYSRLKIIAEYQKIPDYDLRDTFKEYCCEEDSNLEDDKISTIVTALEKLSYSNSSEMYKLKKSIASQVIKLPEPLEKLDKMEDIFIKNNLPTIGKIYSCFEILHPDLSGFNFDSDIISPILKHKSTMGRQFTIFSNLIRTTLASNNRSVNDYLDNIEVGSNLYKEIMSGKKSYDSLSEEDKKTMNLFSKHLETLYNNSMKGKKEPFASDKNGVEKIDELVTKLSPNGSSDYNIADRVVRMFCGHAGISTMKEAKDFIESKFQQAQLRNIQASKHDMTLDKGDFIKGIGDITYLPSILESGSRAKEFLGADSDSDLTPLDTDISIILDNEGTIKEKINRTVASAYGPIYFAIKPDDDFIITRDDDGEKNITNDMTKIEVFKTGVRGKDHYGIEVGFPTTKITSLMLENYDKRVGLIVAMSNGGYVPVRDMEGRTVFTYDDYKALRNKMSGLSHYKENDYNFSDNLVISEVEELKEEIEANNELTAKKREKINRAIEEAMQEVGLELKTKIDGDLSSGVVELIDTGSTGRGTNKPGDGDFDFMMRLDRKIMSKTEELDKVKQILLRKLCKEDTNDITSFGDFRLKDVKLDDEDSVDIDISFITKTDEVSYSTDMALEDRLETIKKIDKEKYNYVVANILLAKQVLKEANVYKKASSDPSQGGLGGVGIENWILQNGGSFVDAMDSFLDAAKDKDFNQFKDSYQIWDFGENHTAARVGIFSHDNFVDNMSDVGYRKMKETLIEYKNYHKLTNQTTKQY